MKNKVFSLINIFGLALGMAVCMIALTKIKGAFDYDNFHPDPTHSYRITTHYSSKKGEKPILLASTPFALGKYLIDHYPAIEKSASVHFLQSDLQANGKTLPVTGIFSDIAFYEIFGFSLASGYPATGPQTIVLTEETARLFFPQNDIHGKSDLIGKTVTIGKSGHFTISGIFKKPISPSHLQFGFVASMANLPKIEMTNSNSEWTNEAAAYTYVKLRNEVPEKALRALLSNVTERTNSLFLAGSSKNFSFDFQRLDKISPAMKAIYNITAEPILPNLIVMSLIGLGILLLAFFNYINLTLAHSLNRAKEVGIRKTAGALRYQLAMQFLTESVLVACIAFCIAGIIMKLISRQETVHRLIADVQLDWRLWIYFLVFTVLTGFLAGWIPSRVLSSFRPVQVLNGKFSGRLLGGFALRKSLVVLQFSASLVAMIVILVFYRQSNYMATADYGFNHENILNLPIQASQYEKLSNAFSKVPGIVESSATSELFGYSGGWPQYIRKEKGSDSFPAVFFSVSASLIRNFELKIIAGSNFSAESEKSHLVILNEEACRMLRMADPRDAVGQLIWSNDSIMYRIIAVVKDFHYASFLNRMQPLALTNETANFRILSVKIDPVAGREIIPKLASEWKKILPSQPFEAKWYNEELYEHHSHKDDLVFIGMLTAMALIVATLGLLAMVIYTTKNRLKEISIRRVLGAKIWQVIFTVSKDFFWLLIISLGIGLPLGFIAGEQFLRQYAYRISLGFGILAECGISILLIGGFVIIWQAYRSSIMNPVKNLRGE